MGICTQKTNVPQKDQSYRNYNILVKKNEYIFFYFCADIVIHILIEKNID